MKKYLLSLRYKRLAMVYSTIVILLIPAIVVSNYNIPTSFLEAVKKTFFLKSNRIQNPAASFGNDFQAGQLSMAMGDFQKAREHFTNYLQNNKVRVDSDQDLANLIGLGLACEALEDYRFAAGYFQLAAMICLKRWQMIPSSQGCNFFSSQTNGFSRLEPFRGLMRLAVQEKDPYTSFYWSEKIHLLKMKESVLCRNLISQPDGHEEIKIKELFAYVYKEMGRAIDLNDRKLFLEINANLKKLNKKYFKYLSESSIKPVKPRDIPLNYTEALLEYQVTEHNIFAWLIHNQLIINNSVININLHKLENKINSYLISGNNNLNNNNAGYYPHLGQELYNLLLKELLLPLRQVKKLIIIPDGVLWKLPFETLINYAFGDGNLLTTQGNSLPEIPLDIEYYHSATELKILRQNLTYVPDL